MSVFRVCYSASGGTSKRTRNWYVEFRDHRGVVRRIPGFRDKRATQMLERHLLHLVAVRAARSPVAADLRLWLEGLAPKMRDRLVSFGLVAKTDAAALRPIRDLVPLWRAALDRTTTKHRRIREVTSMAERVLDAAGVVYWSEATADAVVHHRTPLSTGGPTQTDLDDLAILCSNCHRMILRTSPMLSVEEFRKIHVRNVDR